VSVDLPASPRNVAVHDAVPWKTVVGQTYTVRINVTVENQGDYLEYSDVSIYANASLVARFDNLVLANSSLTVICAVWNTTDFPKATYTISAVIDLVPNETAIVDNVVNFTGTVLVTIAGDVTSMTGMPDGLVDMRDIGAICARFGTTHFSTGWNPNIDVTDDDVVNMRDIGVACNNFGKT
jgi:hypothetical protein